MRPRRQRSDAPRRSGSDPMSLQHALDRWRSLASVASADVEDTVSEVWDDLMGPLAAVATPTAVVDAKLIVHVTDPAATDAVKWRVDAVRAAVNERHGEGTIDSVSCRFR